ncbi:penicillin-binding protein 2 [Rhizorhabdus dicambivorans]|uniref:Penicillin-binding protein 2 n=1 Tax=Rhizorhabdus dicambivorans TaxID=1850238 RepID=A0A2A4FPR8_9SPHN|nr:penicillin-binding protein 2 [Rhizorhabdus dicambivorans]ATE67329.1 penicillin-binding protein 2 [Rhizorhabdus dicambivorans]PCE39666.1 penicillin-binding protein 2 [Rhizorhabdus dicambivorans]
MSRTRLITEQTQAYTFTRRAFFVGGAQAAVGTLLAGRMAWLSIAQNERYTNLSESNRVQLTLVPPRRGWIIDRNGKPIAINRTTFRVDIIPDQLKNPEAVLGQLGRLLVLTADDLDRIREDIKKSRGFQPVPVAENIDYEHFAAVSVHQPSLPGVAPASGYGRFYPGGAAVAHLVGYVGPASAADYDKTRDPLLITPGFKIGKEGLERTMENWLRGKPGAKRSEVTAHGKVVRELTTRPEVVGNALQLTIDAGLQRYAAARLGPESASAVVIDTRTGGILAMASMPAYDPNSFSDGISHAEWDLLSNDDHLPLTNKVMQGLYPPGSTVKPMVALALLEAGVDPNQMVSCSGRYRLGNSYFHCWRRGGHGGVDMHRAIAASCDVYFYTMARLVGIDRIAATARMLGMGAEFDLPMPSQRYGTVPDVQWKARRYKGAKWTTADTLNSTIGQGYTLANPLQLAVMAARIASGNAIVPRMIVNKRYPAQGGPLGIAPDHLAFVREAMSGVVNGPYGTGGSGRLNLPGGELLAGKTGTAQVRRITMAMRAAGGEFGGYGVPWRYRDHGLFIGFAPVHDPRYAVSVVIEHGMHGAAGAPIARDLITYLYDRKRAEDRLAFLEEGWGGSIEARMARKADAWAHRNDPKPVETKPAAEPSPAPPPTGEADPE